MASLPEIVVQSNLLQMQIDELLNEVKLKDKRYKLAESWLDDLQKTLLELPETPVAELSDISWRRKSKIKIPLVQAARASKGIFRFLPPAEIRVVGSFPLGLCFNPNVTIDVALQIPKECFQHKDYLNQCYHLKRALYMTHIAEGLHKNELIEDLWFTYHHDDHMKPLLLLKPKGKLSKHFTVCLMPYPPPSFFKPVRFNPMKSNVRSSWFFNGSVEFEDCVPTPHYNASILVDIFLTEHLQYLQEKFSDARELKNGIILLKFWLHQYSLDQGKGGFTGFMMTMLVAYLLTKRKISSLMSSYQIMRNTLLALSQMQLTDVGLSFDQDGADKPLLSEFHQAYDVVFVDHLGWTNLTASVSRETFERIKHEATLCVKYFDMLQSGSFDGLFVKPISFFHKFDHLIHISQVDALIESAVNMNLESKLVDHSGDMLTSVLSKIVAILKTALGKRIHLIDTKHWTFGKWKVTDAPADPNCVDRITLGILLNADAANNVIERGPSADTPQAKDFREFWGPVSELRHFQDGSICEAVLWKASCLAEKRVVAEQIIRHALKRHLGIPTQSLEFFHNQLEKVLILPDVKLQNEVPYGTGEEANISVMQAFGSLSKRLRNLGDLPLPVTSVQGISQVFRFTEVFPPRPVCFPNDVDVLVTEHCLKLKERSTVAPPWVEPLKVVVHVEGSGKWPDDVQALRRVKAAFHIKISELLNSNYSTICLPRPEYVDVFQDGYVFRIEVACHKEITLLKQVTTHEGMVKIVETDEAKELEYTTEILPKLTGIIHGLQQQHSTFSTACRLAKRWISSQLLTSHLPEVVIEILVAYIYTTAAPFSVPGSPQVAFLRFLNLLATYDWSVAPLIVLLNNEMKNEEIAEIQMTFRSQRPTLPPMFIATPLDKIPSMWTRKAPTAPILHRLVSLSRAALETLGQQLNSPQSQDFKLIFRPPLDVYDVIIHLKVKQVPRNHMAIDAVKLPALTSEMSKDDILMPIVGHDPVESYLDELQESYGEFALFFYDKYGGDKIAVLWKPHAFLQQQFKVSHINGRMISEMASSGHVNIIPNVEAMIDDFSIIGSGLVHSIETKTEKWIID